MCLTFSHLFLSLPCEFVYSNKQPEDSDVMTARKPYFSDVTLKENWPRYCFLAFQPLLALWPKFAECLTNLKLLRKSICVVEGSS